MFIFFLDNKLVATNRSGFKPGIPASDDGLEVRNVFLDISKAFDKVWHERVIFNLEQNYISGDLLNILTDFLSNRKQRVALNGLNGQVSTWASIDAGVLQGSILDPFLFLIYINDLSDNLASNVKLFADDTSLFSLIHDINVSTGELKEHLKKSQRTGFSMKNDF